MPTLDNAALVEILIALVVLNAVLAGLAYVGSRRRRETGRAQVAVVGLAGAARPPLAAAAGPAGMPSAERAPADPAAEALLGVDGPTDTGDRGEATVAAGGLVDPETGLESSLAWDEALRHEEARVARYGRMATVVVVELEGLDQLGERLGGAVADKLIYPVAETLRRTSRASDVVARVGRARFHVLMPETDEVAAINFVDRFRASADMWLEAAAVAVRVAVGWASPPAHGSLADALRLADERMQADRRNRTRPRSVPRVRARVGGDSGPGE
jgi:diguanylate cyclase (GGDEF)-like protein